MRKVLVLLLAILMVFAIVSCKDEPEKSGQLPVEKETGKEKLIEQGAAAKAVDHTGFNIEVTLNEGEGPLSFAIGGKDGVYWLNLAMPMFFRDHENKTYYYLEGLGWYKVAEGSLKDNVFDEMADSILYAAYEDEVKDVLKSEGVEKKNGRDCSKYSVSYTDPEDSTTYKFSIWVDNEFGITMGMEALAGGKAFTYVINPKLSGLVEEDLPAGYATAFACDTYYDSYSL